VLSLVISGALIRRIKKDIDFHILKRLILGSSLGLPVGMVIFLLIDMDKLKLVISIIILILTFLLIFRFRITQSKRKDIVIGGISGSLTTSIGMPGPPLLCTGMGKNYRLIYEALTLCGSFIWILPPAFKK